MRIEHVETILAGRWLYYLVVTDSGLCGVGEAGLWTFPAAAQALDQYLRPYLLGRDPLQIERHWQYVYRNAHFRGAALAAALAAIDVALWDIAGKHFGVPTHVLLGGRQREKARVYMHIAGATADELCAAARAAVADGFDAVRFDPFKPKWPNGAHAAMIRDVTDRVGAVRETVGHDVDICLESHFKLSPWQAMDVSRALEPLHPFFLEDPLPPESSRSIGELARRATVPIATGERLQHLDEFRELLEAGPIAFVRPDVCLLGLTGAKKVAALAEAWRVGVVPHNWLSPINTAASVQLDAAIPNFALQEYTGENDGVKRRLVREPLRREGPYLIVPDAPGIGVELDLEFARALPPDPLPLVTRTHEDGSVVDL